MILSRFVAARATRAALIAASVPELTNRTRSIDGISIATRWASCVSSSVGAPKLVPREAVARKRLEQAFRSMAVDQRAPRHHVVDVLVAVRIFDRGAAAADDEQRRGANRLERPYRAVDTSGQDARGGGKELFGPLISGAFPGGHLATIARRPAISSQLSDVSHDSAQLSDFSGQTSAVRLELEIRTKAATGAALN